MVGWLIAVVCVNVCVCFRAEGLLEILHKRAAAQPIMPVSILSTTSSPDKNPNQKASETNSASM